MSVLTPSVIYLDNHLFVVDKPAGMLTQPNGSAEQSLEEWSKLYIKTRFNKPGAVFLHALHRLDRPVSGLVLFARTSKALSRLNACMRAKQMSKLYLGQVEGSPDPAEGVLEHYLIHGEHSAILANSTQREAKLARLSYRTCRVERNCWLEILLETGRYHQIRAQFAAIGHPIIGDSRYGSAFPGQRSGIALQHYQFQFPHPVSGEMLSLTAAAPLVS